MILRLKFCKTKLFFYFSNLLKIFLKKKQLNHNFSLFNNYMQNIIKKKTAYI